MNAHINFEPEIKTLLCINIPDKEAQRNVEWNLNNTVESLKSYIIKIVHGLKDPLNYGFFLPPSNGKSGKFLQEERLLKDYIGSELNVLEFKKKVRSYHANINAPKIKKINSKSNQKQFIQFIRMGDVMKINKYLNNGLDPNFLLDEFETPLSLACKLKDPHVIIMALVNNGAFMDYRASDSLTPLHKVAIEGLIEPMKTLLQLGQNPNCKDSKGYTPLYYCIECDSPDQCVQLLLFEHSIIGIRDDQGLQEIHKACLYGRTKHLDLLLSYGADIDAKTYKGNSALHICAVHNQGACARLLLYRGITRNAINDETKTAYQTALLSNHIELADLIQNYRDEDVVPVNELPKFNEKRRSLVLSLKRISSLGESSEYLNDDLDTMSGRFSEFSSHSLLDDSASNSPSSPHRSQKESKLVDTYSLHDFASDKQNIKYVNKTWTKSGDTKSRSPLSNFSDSNSINQPRYVNLKKNIHGFGFVIRGIKSEYQNEIENFVKPSTQYFEHIAENSPASKAGIKIGDFLLEVNNVDVHNFTHDKVVSIIKSSGDTLKLKVISIDIKDASSNSSRISNEIKMNRPSSINPTNLNTNSSKENLKEDIPANTKQHSTAPIFPKDKQNDDVKVRSREMNPRKAASQYDNLSINSNKLKGMAPPPPPTRHSNTYLAHPNVEKKTNLIFNQTIKPASEENINEQSSLQKVIPPPDYITDPKLNATIKEIPMPTSCPPPPLKVLPPPPPPPPAPPPPPPTSNTPNKSLVITESSLKNAVLQPVPIKSEKDIEIEPLNDHDELLKSAVLMQRQKIESGKTNYGKLDTIINNNKSGNKSMVFEVSKNTKDSDMTDSSNSISQNGVTKTKPKVPIPSSKNLSSTTQNTPIKNETQAEEVNYKLKAERIRMDIVKKEQEAKRGGTLYFSNQ